MDDHGRISPARAERLNNPQRLETQLSEAELARLLALKGDEDILDLGSGTGFYTDRIAASTTGTVFAVDVQPEMHEHYRRRGVPANVRLILGDITHLSVQAGTVDVACCISTWHEVEGNLDLAGLARTMRPGGRLVVIDWRRDADSWEGGPPEEIRSTKEEVAASLPPYFTPLSVANVGPSMFAVVAAVVPPTV